MIEHLKSAAALAIAACILLGALLFAYSKIRKDGASDGADAPGRTTPAAASSDQKERLELVRELCTRTGIGEHGLGSVLDDQAGPPVPPAPGAHAVPARTRSQAQAVESQDVRTPSAYDLRDALQFALKVAARDDDYGAMGVEHEQDDGPREIEVSLFDSTERDRAELFAKLIANAHDMLVETRFAAQRDALTTLIEDLSVRRDDAIEAMHMPTTVDTREVGTRRDRQLCDFYFALAQRLRSRGYLRQLNASGRPGTTDSALLFELPDVLDALAAEAPEIASLSTADVRELLEMSSSRAKKRVAVLLESSQPRLSGPEA